ncbi:hypothetical protein EEB14_29195 [Rhodococcus sp. WS4]|nr:hypothetical protein EEB14_29195 [Rhodococcus sp. WS4]
MCSGSAWPIFSSKTTKRRRPKWKNSRSTKFRGRNFIDYSGSRVIPRPGVERLLCACSLG